MGGLDGLPFLRTGAGYDRRRSSYYRGHITRFDIFIGKDHCSSTGCGYTGQER
jgi:hypothetical protein